MIVSCLDGVLILALFVLRFDGSGCLLGWIWFELCLVFRFTWLFVFADLLICPWLLGFWGSCLNVWLFGCCVGCLFCWLFGFSCVFWLFITWLGGWCLLILFWIGWFIRPLGLALRTFCWWCSLEFVFVGLFGYWLT